MNLGKYDFYPAAAGKGGVVTYLQTEYGVRTQGECRGQIQDSALGFIFF